MTDRCACPMRDGAHEGTCGKVEEMEYVHCQECDKAVWMCEMSFGMCQQCQVRTGVWKRMNG